MTLPHLSTPTTARTVAPQNVGDLYASPCITLTAFPWQQRIPERASVLPYT